MEGFLLLVGVIVGVVFLVRGRPSGRDGSPGESIGVGEMAGLSPPGSLDEFGAAGSALNLDDDSWPIDRHHELSGPFDDFSSGARDTAWPSDSIAFDEPNRAFGNGMDDDSYVHRICVNPATGLPMVSDTEAGFDVGGNPYGFSNDDLSVHHDSAGFGFDNDSSSHSSFGSDDWS